MTDRNGETYRHALTARRTDPASNTTGGGSCTLLVIRLDSQVLLLHEGALSTGAALTPAEAAELADSLTEAAQRR